MSGAVRRTRSTGAATTASSSSSSSRSRKRTVDDTSDGGESDTSTTRTRKSLKTIPPPVNEEEDEDMDPYAERAASTSTSSASTLTPSKRKDPSDDDTSTKRARMTPSKRSTRTSTSTNGNTSPPPPRRVTRGSSRTRDVKPTNSTSASLETIPDQDSVLTRVPSLISRNPRGRRAAAASASASASAPAPAPVSESEPAIITSTTETETVTRTSSSPQMDRIKTQSWDYRDQVMTSTSTSSSTTIPSSTSSTSITSSTDVDGDADVDDEEWATQRERYVEMEKRVREGLAKAGQEISPKISQLFTRLTDRSNTLSIHDANVIEQEIMELLRTNGSLHVGVYDASHPSPHYELEPEFTRGLAVEDIPIPSTVLEQENFAMVVDSGALNVATKMLEIDPQLVNQVGGLSRAPALSYAIKNHDLNMVRFLLNHRANPTIRDDKGNTPLHYCAIHKNADAIPLLLECGALPDLKTRNAYGLTPIGEGQKRQFYINLNDYGIAQYGQCSYLQTQTNRSAQWFYECVTCDLVGEKGCCDVCVTRCHQGHQVRLVDLPSRGFCDCGSQGPTVCKALDLPDTDLTTKPPIYIPGSHLSQLASVSASTTSGRPATRRATTPVIPPPWQPTPYEPVATTTPRDPQMDAILKMMEQLLQERTKLDAIKTKAAGEGSDKKKRRKRTSLSVSDLFKYAIVVAFTAILLFILWDTYHASIAVGIEEQRAEGIVRQQTARDQYVHDCIDANITGLRRISVYNTKRNGTGHLIDDADCERYKRYMAMDPLKLAQGEGKIVARKIAETMNSFFSNLSAKTIGAWYLCQQGIEGIAQKASMALDYLPYGNVIRGVIQAGSAASAGTTTK